THILYLGTTGSGKTEGLKSLVTSALTWGSGFVYIDGKADTDLWSSLSSLVRRFGRDDDLLVLNYMTGNSDAKAPSNTMNPFSSGSASYLAQMLISLMPEAEGDNAMWKERAVSLLSSLMPALTWKRDNQDYPLSVSSIRECLNLDKVIQFSRDEALPEKIRESLKGYLDTLPGYVEDAFDDQGKEKPMGPDAPMVDTTTVRQQHGYLTMQFTRSLQSLGDDYGYIFDTQAADIDMVDVVLNRRVLIALIPALEKSGDESANLGKIIATTIKGMMGSTLGATLEGDSSKVIENKPTHSSTPFMSVFDEVGYYASQGMGVMAAQARSLGFCLVFSAQDLQAMEKRIKEEAKSITANCNIKIFGKLQDPTQTREFFENHIGKDYIAKVSSFQLSGGISTGSYQDTQQVGIDTGSRADYDDLKEMQEGEAIISFSTDVIQANIFYSNPGHAKAMRVTRYVALPEPDETFIKHASAITKLRDKLCGKEWTALKADVAAQTPEEIEALQKGYAVGTESYDDPVDYGITALCALHAHLHPVEAQEAVRAIQTAEEVVEMAPVEETNTTQQTKDPISWNDLVEEGNNNTQASATPAPVKFITKKLNKDVEDILKKAGNNLQSALIKSGNNGDKIDAEE
ncbi:MAG: type IV secretion system DNA-binding domain-containing protein, partial [Alphaproteobacteria bacterium]|nr:type IV secretion system DNA-binding domain-containing protein [Alphaproteobacteria bacterium]